MWKLLTKEKIISLSSIDLASYMNWLEKYKKEKLEELSEKKKIIENINSSRMLNNEVLRKKQDEDKIAQIREFLLNNK